MNCDGRCFDDHGVPNESVDCATCPGRKAVVKISKKYYKPSDFGLPPIHQGTWKLACHRFYQNTGRNPKPSDKDVFTVFVLDAYMEVIESKNKILTVQNKLLRKEKVQ